MTVKEVVEIAIKQGCLTPKIEEALLRALEYGQLNSEEDDIALEELQAAVRDGRVVTRERKRCFNIMEELVWEALEKEYSNILTGLKPAPDVGEVAAFALNHLKPLYATTERGAEFHRIKARDEHWELVKRRVREALEHSMGQPIWYPNRKPLAQPVSKDGVTRAIGRALDQKKKHAKT